MYTFRSGAYAARGPETHRGSDAEWPPTRRLLVDLSHGSSYDVFKWLRSERSKDVIRLWSSGSRTICEPQDST